MLPEDRPADAHISRCPTCQGEIRFVRSMTMSRGPALASSSSRFYFEIAEYHCEKDGAVYLTREGIRREDPGDAHGPTAPIREPLHPRAPLKRSGIALSE